MFSSDGEKIQHLSLMLSGGLVVVSVAEHLVRFSSKNFKHLIFVTIPISIQKKEFFNFVYECKIKTNYFFYKVAEEYVYSIS